MIENKNKIIIVHYIWKINNLYHIICENQKQNNPSTIDHQNRKPNTKMDFNKKNKQTILSLNDWSWDQRTMRIVSGET